jgi:hypothetical protein
MHPAGLIRSRPGGVTAEDLTARTFATRALSSTRDASLTDSTTPEYARVTDFWRAP